MCVSHVHQRGRGVWETKEEDRRTIPERMATYFLTTISLANLFSPGSTNEVEAAGLSETATTIPLRKPRDDILQPEKYRGSEERRGGGGRGRKRDPDSLYPLEDFSGKIEKLGIGRKKRAGAKTKEEFATRWPHVRPKSSFSNPPARLLCPRDGNVVSVRSPEISPSPRLGLKLRPLLMKIRPSRDALRLEA